MTVQKCLDDIPGGAVGRHFVDMLPNEITMLSRQATKSERLIVFWGSHTSAGHNGEVGSKDAITVV